MFCIFVHDQYDPEALIRDIAETSTSNSWTVFYVRKRMRAMNLSTNLEAGVERMTEMRRIHKMLLGIVCPEAALPETEDVQC